MTLRRRIPRPPRLAEVMIEICVPRGGVRDALLGDLHEMHAARVGDRALGAARAALWYWTHALRISAGYLLRRGGGGSVPYLHGDGPANDGRRTAMHGLEGLLADARHAVRGLARAPGFALAALLTLALGVGANTAVFSIVNAVYLTPLGFRDAGALVQVGRSAQDGTYRMSVVTPGTWSDWAAGQTVFESFAGFRYWTTTVERAGVASRITAVHSVGSIFDVLGVPPLLGRTFTSEEEGPGREGLAVLSHAYWQREFGGEDPVGSVLVLDGVPHEVIGVMPRTFTFPDASTDLWKTADLTAAGLLDREDHFVNAIGRLAAGVTLAQAGAGMEKLHAALRESDAEHLAGSTAELVPLRDVVLGDVGPLWLTLMGVVGLVLLIACVNVTNLLLSRAHGRTAELALRRALGAGRGRIARQLVTESLVLAGLGGLAGFGLGWLFLRGMLAWMPGGVPRAEAIDIDLPVLLFTVVVSTAAGVLSGAVPALQVADASIGSRLRTRRHGQARIRTGLMAAEVALAVVLSVGAGLAVRGFATISALDPGFDSTRRTVAHVELQGDVSDATRGAFYDNLQMQLSEMPGVRAVGVTSVFPMAGFTPGTFAAQPGEVVSAGSSTVTVRYAGVTPTFREAAGIPLLLGRDLRPGDGRTGTPAILLSRSAADLLFPGGNALGSRIYLGPDEVVAPVSTIVGVVGDVRQRGMTQPPTPMAYVPRENIAFWRGFDVVIETSVGSRPPAPDAIREVARRLHPQAVVLGPVAAGSYLSDALAGQRNTMLLFTLMGLVAMALAMVGVFGVVAFQVGQRRREMGIRVAVGASRRTLQAMILRQSLRPVLVGAAIGTIAAVWLSRFVEGVVAGIERTDPLTLAAVPVLLALVAAIAAWLPARRASRVDPVRVLSES